MAMRKKSVGAQRLRALMGDAAPETPAIRKLDRALTNAVASFLVEPQFMTYASAEATAPGNVVGVGVSKKRIGGEREVPSLTFLVRRKVGPPALEGSASSVPKEFDGFTTSVEQVGDVEAYFTGRYRPAGGGASIGNCGARMAGTLGCEVEDNADDSRCILSNNHVLALVDTSLVGTGIPQPGLLDGGVCNSDVVATLKRAVPISFVNPNFVDCAIARITVRKAVDRRMMRPGTPNPTFVPLTSPHIAPVLGAPVQKSGRTTGHTLGLISLVATTISVNMGTPAAPRMARFDDQFRVTGTNTVFSQPGDSGSLVTTDPDNQPVGLLFAGGGGYTFCNDIDAVLTNLNLKIVY
jgi:hypothetical protein